MVDEGSRWWRTKVCGGGRRLTVVADEGSRLVGACCNCGSRGVKGSLQQWLTEVARRNGGSHGGGSRRWLVAAVARGSGG